MNTITDTVEQVITRKTPRAMAYNLKLTNNGFIGAGFEPPQCSEGDTVTLQYTLNDKGYMQMVKGSLQVVASGTAPAPSQPQPQPQTGGVSQAPAGGGQTKAGYWDDKEKRDLVTQRAIQYQASRNAAIQLAEIALQHDCISLGAKKADRADILLAFVDEVTDRYNKDVTDYTTTGSRVGQYDDNKQDNEATEVGEFDQ